MGAVAAVLLAPADKGITRQQPLTLTAAKAMMGHSEPAAGLVGLLTIAAELRHSTAPGLLHLATLNPYVGSVLTAAGSGTGDSGLVSMSRQTRGASRVSEKHVHGGVSSFAFQGTNAHAVISTTAAGFDSSLAGKQGGGLSMQKQAHWVLPKPHSLLGLATCHTQAVVMQCQLANPSLAFFKDHQVMGRALFPAAGMLEVAAAAAKSILHDQHTDCDCTICGMIIAAPIVLADAKLGPKLPNLVLQTSVNVATGLLQISCISDASSGAHMNARCTIGAAVPLQAVAPVQETAVIGGFAQFVTGLAAAAAARGCEGTRGRRAGPRTGTGAGAEAAVAADAVAQVTALHLTSPCFTASCHASLVSSRQHV